MPSVSAGVRVVDLLFALFAQDQVEAGAQGVTPVREPPGRDGGVQSGQVLFCQTYWDLSCHTSEYTEVCGIRSRYELRVGRSH
jgi:hypothetical protein